jgi:hypothetical protein
MAAFETNIAFGHIASAASSASSALPTSMTAGLYSCEKVVDPLDDTLALEPPAAPRSPGKGEGGGGKHEVWGHV